jgi:hypothetical protein
MLDFGFSSKNNGQLFVVLKLLSAPSILQSYRVLFCTSCIMFLLLLFFAINFQPVVQTFACLITKRTLYAQKVYQELRQILRPPGGVSQTLVFRYKEIRGILCTKHRRHKYKILIKYKEYLEWNIRGVIPNKPLEL